MAASSIRSNGLFPRRWERSSSSEFEEEEEEEEEVHVLAVDDSVVDRKVIERLLKITSCKVTTVESGWRALQYLGLDQDYKTTSPPPPPPNHHHHHHHHDFNVNGMKVDLIITDYCMPGMTGYELLKKIKGSATFREIPVVIMSSENVVARIDRCLEEGAEDFIVKPVKLSDVKRLKDYMFGSDNRATIPAAATTSNIINNNNNHHEDKTIISSFNKRKLQEIMSSSPSPSPSTSPSPTMSPASTSQSPPTTTSSSPPSSLSSPSMSPDPFSPSQLESPTMRLKVTNSSSSSDDDDDDDQL